ncbi:AAA family ATPase [Lacrimispora xylanisolvens]|uniref:AAA family ATPase n=1 Tax=Lacrimispora xylanisolvens TaxID=384636 RepID=UPI0024027986
MSGLRASGKSSVISEITLDAVESENNVGIFSGELAPKNFMRWMDLQAAGRGYTEPTQFEGYYNVSRKYKEQIAEWLGQHFFLYNNDYGNDYRAVAEQFEKAIEEKKLDLLILDNLMAFNILCLSDNKFEAQTAFILDMQRIAKKHNVHVLFVAHPRKAMGFLRLDDISGTADLGNAVDNALIVHRVNNDFKRLGKQMFGWNDNNPLFESTNVIEIAKDRDGGTMDYFVPLHYEIETKRLKNSPAENKIYGWNKSDDGFLNVEQGEIPFD